MMETSFADDSEDNAYEHSSSVSPSLHNSTEFDLDAFLRTHLGSDGTEQIALDVLTCRYEAAPSLSESCKQIFARPIPRLRAWRARKTKTTDLNTRSRRKDHNWTSPHCNLPRKTVLTSRDDNGSHFLTRDPRDPSPLPQVSTMSDHGSTGHEHWPVTHVTHSDLLTHLTRDPWPADPLSSLLASQLTYKKLTAKNRTIVTLLEAYSKTHKMMWSH